MVRRYSPGAYGHVLGGHGREESLLSTVREG
jgi:hypothetical protein